ncbi:ligand-binding sensor domain-containing protein [Pedobacter jamesrossensis]|uniref:Two-component regulator propeller domain-containing protein n=1 Tax=Pedobacter jamesrossensis TaxID=1908238 RepID=A0ABV8NI69_9SPHI
MYCKLFAIKLKIIISFILLTSLKLSAQNYNFSNYSLKEGLPQSQVKVIYQAKNRTLWLGTFGGVSNFDGKEFTSYSKANGLISNSIRSIVEDNQNQIFLGTEAGINTIKNGKISTLLKSDEVYALNKDKNGTIWGISDYKLFSIKNNKQIFCPIEGLSITSLNADATGNLFVCARGRGIYRLVNGVWILHLKLPASLAVNEVKKILFDKKNRDKIYLLTLKQGVFVSDKDGVKPLFSDKKALTYYSIEQDSRGDVWVGTENGAYLIKKKSVIYFNSNNGLTDNRIDEIFSDAENNIWISSSSDGIFKYEGDAFIKYNTFKGQNLAYPISGIAADKKNNLWIGTFNKGLLKYEGAKIENVKKAELENRNIYFVFSDKAKNIWVSAAGNGIWKYDGQKFNQAINFPKMDFNSMGEDEEGGLWLNSPNVCLYIKSGKTARITGFNGYTSCIYPINKDSVLLGTSSGIYLIKNRVIDKHFQIKALSSAFVLSIIKHGNNFLFATLGDGMISWNSKTKESRRYTTKDGLNSNDVYSLALDDHDRLWIGTGRGINKFKFNTFTKAYEVYRNNQLIIECNQNAILNYKNNIIVGTISGLVRCKTGPSAEIKQAPFIKVGKVNIYRKNNKAKDIVISSINKDLHYELSYNQNHLTIHYNAIFLTNPKAVTYKYRLVGLDAEFGSAAENTEVEYSALRPGNYTFQVIALANGQQSNVAELNLTIVPPFYDTIIFKSFAVLLIVLLIWLIFYLFFKAREKKKQSHEEIKLKEQEKIRKQTAEDFHDDIGNKLTRINVLSEILDKKVNDQEVEQKEIIRLIKENAGLLYSGTKDILWALDPKSDNLFEILVHIKNFGIDLFQNTGIDFKMEGILPEYQKLQLSMEFNRNLSLIFKEMLNNALKHANATQVIVLIESSEQNMIKISTTDDGKGFDFASITMGSGLKNIKNRCKRINSTFKISSTIGLGTRTTIFTKILLKK